ncbi:MAG: 4-hydroxy-tetrahydrodipicolinate synthase [Alphaproteobacteria bacterium]|nr:4-hydroxy-tetrahydrodipicolinate synthase [Alphaproteobacteria bacterium]
MPLSAAQLHGQLQGSMVALITPFKGDGIDAAAFKKFIDWQIAEGTDALVPAGTTGESPTLSHDEHRKVVELCVEAARGRVPVIAGTGSNSTAEALDLTKHAKQAGADVAMLVCPYYNKPTQEGLYRHYATVAEAVDIPIIIYNIPGRSVVDMAPETMGRLAKIANIVGVKDATNDLSRPIKTKRACGDKFRQMSGEDHTALAFLAQGGHGCISVTANVAPRLCAQMHDAWRQGAVETAMQVNEKLAPLHDALFCETSPGPVKFAASLLKLSAPDTRLPLGPIADASKARVEAALKGLGLLH